MHISDLHMQSSCLWIQVHTLLKGLEKIAASADIPMLVAGDFNSVPGSAAHSLLVNRVVESSHPVCHLLQSCCLSQCSLMYKTTASYNLFCPGHEHGPDIAANVQARMSTLEQEHIWFPMSTCLCQGSAYMGT